MGLHRHCPLPFKCSDSPTLEPASSPWRTTKLCPFVLPVRPPDEISGLLIFIDMNIEHERGWERTQCGQACCSWKGKVRTWTPSRRLPWHCAAFREDGSQEVSPGFTLKLNRETFILSERARGAGALAEKAVREGASSALDNEGVRGSGQGSDSRRALSTWPDAKASVGAERCRT